MRWLIAALVACGSEAAERADPCNVQENFPADGFIVRSLDDLKRVRDAAVLKGLLVCGLSEIQTIELPNLIGSESWIDIRQLPNVETVSMPKLHSAGVVRLWALPKLQGIDFSSLELLREDALAVSLALDDLPLLKKGSFPRLQRAASGISIYQSAFETIDFPVMAEARIISVGPTQIDRLSFPQLTSVAGLHVTMSSIREVSAPKIGALRTLEIFGNGRLERVELQGLVRILGRDQIGGLTLRSEGIATRFEIPQLLEIDAPASITGVTWRSALLPALERVTGALTIEAGSGDEIALAETATVGSLSVRFNFVGRVSLPKLALVENDAILSTNPGLSVLELPSLKRVGGDLIIADNPSYPECEAEAIAAKVATTGTVTVERNDQTAACGE